MCGAEKIHVHSGGEKITAGRERLLAVSSEMRQISILRVAEEVGEPEYLTKESTRWAEVLEELGLAFEGVPGRAIDHLSSPLITLFLRQTGLRKARHPGGHHGVGH